MSRFILASCVCVGYVFSSTSRADFVFDFDLNGSAPGGLINDFVGFDWGPGNALAVGSTNSVESFLATASGTLNPDGSVLYTGGVQVPFTSFYHARIFNDARGQDGLIILDSISRSSLPGTEFTIVARFPELVTSVTVFPDSPISRSTRFERAEGLPNFLEIWYDEADAGTGETDSDMLAGTGFNTGTKILGATVSDISSSHFTSFDVPLVPLDGFGTNDYPDLLTVQGEGAASLTARVTDFDPDFWAGLDPTELNLSFTFDSDFDTSQGLPFDATNPSAAFSFRANGATPTTAGAGLGPFDSSPLGLGDINDAFTGLGGGQSMQFQFNRSDSFFNSTGIPEPSSSTLCSVIFSGGGLLSALRRRRKK